MSNELKAVKDELKAEKDELKRLFIIAVHRNDSIQNKNVFLKAIFSQWYRVNALIEKEAKIEAKYNCNTC